MQWAGTWQWSARPYRFSCHPAPQALLLDRVNRKGEGKPLALAMGQVTLAERLSHDPRGWVNSTSNDVSRHVFRAHADPQTPGIAENAAIPHTHLLVSLGNHLLGVKAR